MTLSTPYLQTLARRRGGPWALLLATCALASLGAKDAADREASSAPAAAAARLIRVDLPITGDSDRRLIQKIKRAAGELKSGRGERLLVLDLRPSQSEFGQGSDFTRALKLARFIATSRDLAGIKTVAFIPRTIKGHAVLVAMACEQIAMGPDAEIGEAGIDEDAGDAIDALHISGYEQIAGSRRTVPVTIALGMLDRGREVLKVETASGVEFVFREDLDELRRTKTVRGEPEPLVAAGELGRFSGRQARDLGFARHLAKDRERLARLLGLPLEALREDPGLAGAYRPIRILLRGPIGAKEEAVTIKLIDDAQRDKKVNFVVLWIDSPGGSVEAATGLATYLASRDPAKLFVVAYIPKEARAEAALLAIACDEIVMAPGAILGGEDERRTLTDQQRLDVSETIRQKIAPHKSRSWSLPAALFAKDLEVHEYTNRTTGVTEYFCEAELEALDDSDAWQQGPEIKPKGKVLTLTGNEAEEFGLARATAENFDKFKELYGLDDPPLVEPGWIETVVRALAHPGVAWGLVFIGFMAMYIELQMPGIGIGGFVATVCFALYFWANHLNHTAGALEVVLFLVGITFLLLEVFVLPGFGIFGLGGGILIIASLVLAAQTFVLPSSEGEMEEFRDSLLIVGGAMVGTVAMAMVMRSYLPRAPLFNQIMLNPPEGEAAENLSDREALADFSYLLGQKGIATTRLIPSGKVRYGDELIDVVADGDLIPPGTEVVFVEVHGNRIVVRAAG